MRMSTTLSICFWPPIKHLNDSLLSLSGYCSKASKICLSFASTHATWSTFFPCSWTWNHPLVWSNIQPLLSIDNSLLMQTLFSATIFAFSLIHLLALLNEIMNGSFLLSSISRAYSWLTASGILLTGDACKHSSLVREISIRFSFSANRFDFSVTGGTPQV